MVCEHLRTLDQELQAQGIGVQWRGRSWWDPITESGEWVFYDCFLELESVRQRLNLPTFVEDSEYDGRVAGQEKGFVCKQCNSAVMGNFKLFGADKPIIR